MATFINIRMVDSEIVLIGTAEKGKSENGTDGVKVFIPCTYGNKVLDMLRV